MKPTQKFYDTFSHKQTLDIISNLTIRHEIPLQYSYLDGGAGYWDQYATRLANEQSPNLLNQTIHLLENSFKDIDRLIGITNPINVVDLGPGNGLPIRPLLEKLISEGRLNRYIAIDISKPMFDILERNIKTWFGEAVKVEGYVRDIAHERFDDLIADDYIDNEDSPINIVCIFGGTLSNLRSPSQALQALNNSLSERDIILYADKLNSPATRRYFDFNISKGSQKLTPRHKLVLDFLNIDESYYEVVQEFDEKKGARCISVVPAVDLLIEFDMSNGHTRCVELRKNEPITLWRSWDWFLMDLINQLDQNDFDLLQLSRSEIPEYLMTIHKIKITE